MKQSANSTEKPMHCKLRAWKAEAGYFDILPCVKKLENTFTLKQMYGFVHELKLKHTNDNNIEAKIRQQLQFLRDKGIIEFRKSNTAR